MSQDVSVVADTDLNAESVAQQNHRQPKAADYKFREVVRDQEER